MIGVAQGGYALTVSSPAGAHVSSVARADPIAPPRARWDEPEAEVPNLDASAACMRSEAYGASGRLGALRMTVRRQVMRR